MNESKHTPGPWEWRQPYENAGYWQLVAIGDHGNHLDGSKIYPVIHDDGSAGDEYSPSIDVHGPNGRLIAAAPELLAACKALMGAPHYDHFAARLNDEEMAAIDMIKAAIAKAED